jgi:YD repeat-containing protein
VRALAFAVLLIGGTATAGGDGLRQDDPELPRPELRSMSSTTYEPSGGKLVETTRALLTYDAKGHAIRLDFKRPDGTPITFYEWTWDTAGRLASRKTRDRDGKLVARTFAYKLDSKGRVVERTLRDPSAPAGEFDLDSYTYAADGSYTVQTERQYPKEGPYRSDSQTFDAMGRMTRQCAEHGGCSMIEYDANGQISRVREQLQGGEHYYRVYETTYDAGGRIAKRVVGGTETSYAYNARGDVVEAVHELAGNITSKTVYAYVYR